MNLQMTRKKISSPKNFPVNGNVFNNLIQSKKS